MKELLKLQVLAIQDALGEAREVAEIVELAPGMVHDMEIAIASVKLAKGLCSIVKATSRLKQALGMES